MAANKPQFTVTLELSPDANDATGVRRLRGLLKVAWRMFRMRCTSVRVAQPADGDEGESKPKVKQ